VEQRKVETRKAIISILLFA